MTNLKRLSFSETFGLRPVGLTLAQTRLVLRGDPRIPPSRFGPSSLRVFTPRLSLATWAGQRVGARTIPILNLFNHTPTPVQDGWSVRATQTRDFRGRGLTYNSHNGTDFVVPPGTQTVAAAAGRVVAIRREFNRGGLKVYLDHGGGLMTSHHHLGRALVEVGQPVRRGQPVALTGYSGLDGFLFFPWVAPHVHYNVVLGGVLVDPFGPPGEVSLWREHNDPSPSNGVEIAGDSTEGTRFDPQLVDRLLAMLLDAQRRRELGDIADLGLRAAELIIEATTYPTRFSSPTAARVLFPVPPERAPRLDLPFRAEDFDAVAFADDLGYRKA